jgi:membrane protease YdiL (CAAX protease family)
MVGRSVHALIRRLGLQFSWRSAAAGIPLFVIYLLVYWVTATLIFLVLPDARGLRAIAFTAHVPSWLMIILLIVNAAFEELLVTGFVIASLAEKGAAIAVAASTLLRFAYHLYQGPLNAVSIIPVGLLLGALFWRARNLWPLIVAHALADVVVYVSAHRG